jgi:hypothetical protein
MYSKYYTVHKKNPSPNNNKSKTIDRMEKNMSSQNSSKRTRNEVGKTELLASRIADRALLLLSFKDTPTQNLHHVLQVLGIHSVEEKRMILFEIFRLIREGIVYVPRGLPLLIDKGIANIEDVSKIDLVLLQPYDHLIAEIQKDIAALADEQE